MEAPAAIAEPAKAKQMNQWIGAIAATMGGFSLGTVIGWSAPASEILRQQKLSSQDIAHISSIMCMGAATAQLIMAFTMDKVGRKWSMIFLSIPFCVAYVLLALTTNKYLYLVGRFSTGLCGGAFCVVAPTYTGELSQKSIRGTLGVMFQLLLVCGILFVFCMGLFKNPYMLNLPMVVPPIICLIMMVFLPESPVLLLMKKKDEKAQKSLQFFRGKNYDTSGEMKEIQNYIQSGEGAFKENMKKKSTLKAFFMLLGMHVIQQLSGINAVMFYATTIFQMSSSDLSSEICTCIVGVTQVVVCGIAAALVEHLGRKMLWMMSLSIMSVCTFTLGFFYIVKTVDEALSKKISFIPLLATCLYIVGFSIGAGPLPWAQLGELLPSGVKGVCAPTVAGINWLLAYGITMSFPFLVQEIGPGPVFLAYGTICVLGLVYVIFFVIETKNKTLDEIQQILGR